jgi:hypothetical protein
MQTYLYANLASLYALYSDMIKPVSAEIETRYEVFPIPILNEIRAYNDHVARCYRYIRENGDVATDQSRKFIDTQTKKAEGHIERIMLDCYKHLNVKLHDIVVVDFEKRTKNVDLSAVNNGEFYQKYKIMRRDVVNNLKKAKLAEVKDKISSIKLYQETYNQYAALEDFLIENDTHIRRAATKYKINRIGSIILWIAAAVLSGFVSSVIPWNGLWQTVLSWIK